MAARVRALVVDDEPPLVQVICGYLAREGFEVLSAGDGESAVALARERRPDVVVLDLMLPGIDGMEVCRQLRTFSDAYVIMLTARAGRAGAGHAAPAPGRTGRRGGAGPPLRCAGGRPGRARGPCRRPAGRADPHRVRRAGRAERRTGRGVAPPAAAGAGVGCRLVRRRPRHRCPRRQPAPQARRRRGPAPVRADRPGRRLPHGYRLMPARSRVRLATRLLAAQVLIVATGAVTLVIVAVVVAPGLFRDHLRRVAEPVPPDLARHLDQALGRALLVSLAVAVAASMATAAAVAWLVTRRLTRPVTALAAAASRVADQHYGTRVPPSRLGPEFAVLDNAFNRMAASLEGTERRRRELLADLAHELRTPVATIESFVEGVEDGVLPATADTWRTLHEQTARLRRLVDDVDLVSRAEERRVDLRPAAVDLDALAAGAVRAVTAAFAAKGVTLRHTPAPAPARAVADPDRVREILDNLLSNALRHTRAGGTVTIATAAGTVAVSDTGDGVAAAHLPHLFERFYRADPARSRATGGSGIVLTIARALARAHGGDLTAASDGVGRGATFTLTLPPGPDRPEPR